MASLREQIVALSGVRETKAVTVPVLGEVTLQSLTEQEWQNGVTGWFRDKDYERIPERQKYDNVKLIQMCLVDAAGTLVFSDSPADLDVLVNLRESITYPLYSEAFKLNRPDLPKN